MKVLREKSKTLRDLLDPAVMGKILAAGSVRSYSDGQVIQQRGDTQPGLSMITTGQVAAGNVGLDGSLLATALLRPGETFGEFTLFAGLPRTQTLWSQGQTDICHVTATRFMKLFDADPSIARAMIALTLQRSYELMEFMDAQRRLSLAARVARLLLISVDAETGSEAIECRHEDLAFMLGVSRVATGKALGRLEKDGFVVRRYGYIEIPDVQAMRSMLAAEDPLFPISQS
jgi:CRP/FNR family transcriptional regulator, cyclic AMP receptor protein